MTNSSPLVKEKPPMKDRHAERVVLSACLRRPSARHEMELTANDFFYPFHMYLFNIVELYGDDGLNPQQLATQLDGATEDLCRLLQSSHPGDELRELLETHYGY